MQQLQGTLPTGTVIRDRYIIEDLLGKGGSGAVYLVRDKRVRGNLFALKEVVDPNKYDRAQFLFEGEVLRRLEHPALPRVYRVFEDDTNNRAYMLMDYVEGPNLEVLRQRRPDKRFSIPQVLAIMGPIMDAVSYLHSQHPPIIHRDIKPANIIVPAESNETMLVDLGIAKEYDPDSTTTAVRRATPGYAAPEQYSRGTNPRTDIYALGATLYVLLTGVVPIDALHRMTQMGSRGIDPLEPVNRLNPAIPQAVADVIRRALSLNSNQRFATIAEFSQALNSAVAEHQAATERVAPVIPAVAPSRLPSVRGRPVESITTDPFHRRPQPARSRKSLLAAVLLVLLALLIIIGAGAVFWPSLTSQQGSHAANPTATAGSHQTATAVTTSTSTTRSPASPGQQPGSTPTPSSSATAAPGAYPNVAGIHNGTIHNTTVNVTSSMELSIQQNGGNISGNLTVGSGLLGSGPFTGTVNTSKHIRFTVHSSQVQAPLLFEGTVLTDGSMNGTYCSLNQQGQCSAAAGGSGTWQVGPVSPGSF